MNLAHLYYFCKLAQLQHYTKAAQELYITQPSLSNAIACLESELGISLFKKHGRNVMLTPYGKEFYDHVSVALSELDTGISIAKENAKDLGGIVDIGCISTIQGDYLPAVMREYRLCRSPDVTFNVYQGQTNHIIEGLLSERFDIGFCSFADGYPDLFFIPILKQALVAAVGEAHELAKTNINTITLKELRKYRLLTYQTEQPLGRDVKKLLTKHRLNAEQSYSDEVTLSGMAIAEQAVAIVLNTPSLRQFHNLITISLPEVPEDFRIVYMVFHKYTYKSHAVEAFIDYITAYHSNTQVTAYTHPTYDQEDI